MPKFPYNLPDDATALEHKIVNYAYANIYSLIPDPMDKFIIAFMFDLGYTAEMTAVALNLSRKTVVMRKKRVKELLQGCVAKKLILRDE